ncbi:MAG: nucleoside 2-deoxyribosyltransferase [archaeon]
MKFFIGQAVTGEDINNLYIELEKIYKILDDKGHTYYSTLKENEEKFQGKTKQEMMNHAFREIDNSDASFAIVRSERKSEGMLMEIGYCLANNKKIVLIINKNVKGTYLRELAENVIEYEDSNDLIKQLSEVDL